MIAACIIARTVSGNNPGQAPVAEWFASNYNPFLGEQIQLFDESTNNPTAWLWFKNGILFSNEQNPVFYCSSPGPIAFRLIASNQFGSSAPNTQNIFVG